jgi:hypothetical protein
MSIGKLSSRSVTVQSTWAGRLVPESSIANPAISSTCVAGAQALA